MGSRKRETLPEGRTQATGNGPGKEEHKMFGIRKSGGQTAPRGNYWNFSTGERVRLTSEAVLPGDGKQAYFRVHPVVLLLSAPVLGLLYAIFLPAIGIVMAIVAVGRKITTSMTHGLAKGATFNWQPSAAYLAHKKDLSQEKKEPKESDETNDRENRE